MIGLGAKLPRSRCLNSFLKLELAKDAGKMEENDRDFAGIKRLRGIYLGHQTLRKFLEGAWDWHHRSCMANKPDQLEAPSPYTLGCHQKEVPVMRYHSLTIEDIARGFCHYLGRRMIKRLWNSTPSYRFMVFNTIQKVSGRQMGSRPWKFCQTNQGAEDETKVLAKVAEGIDLTSAELEAAMEEVVAGRASNWYPFF